MPSVPQVTIQLLPPTQQVQFSKGTTLKVKSVATDRDGDLKAHYIQLFNSEKRQVWSWGEALKKGSGANSVKQCTFTFSEVGKYTLQGTADTNLAPGSWVVSPTIELSIISGVIPPPQPPPVEPPVTPPTPPPPPPPDPGPPPYEPPPVIPSGPILDVPLPYAAGPIPFAVFGDSIYLNKSGQGAPADLIAAAATTATGETCTLMLNASVDGASSAYIVGTAGLLAAKCAAIKASGAKVTLVRFGHNDSKLGVALTKETFKANMQTICDALVTQGEQTVVLNYPIMMQEGSYNGLWTRASIQLLESYLPMLDQVCNQTTTRQGNRSLFVHFTTHPDQQFDGVHPWYEGIAALANGDAMGMKYALKPVASMPIIKNQDGTINAAGYAAYWKTEDPRAWSRHWGPTWQEKNPNGTEDRDELFTKELKYDSQIYDRLGEGVPVPPIDGSLQDPGKDMHPVNCAAQVIPRTDGPTHPAVDPGVNNYFYGLPDYCTNPDAPENWNPDPYIRNLLMLDHRQRTIRLNDDYWMSLNGGDYNSDGGTVTFHSEDRINHCGLDKFQGSAQYNLCFAMQPKRNSGGFLRDSTLWTLYASLYKRQDPYGAAGEPLATALSRLPSNPVWSDRANFINSSEAWIDDAYGAGTTQPLDTSRDGNKFPVPVGGFLPGEIPGPFSISTMNEFKASIVWDTNTNPPHAKIVVFAMQGWGLPGHSPPYYGFSNEGSWTSCHRIDEFPCVDEHGVPMKYPTSIVMATDATLKPVNPDPGQINLADAGQRAGYRNSSLDNAGNYSSFARSGCIMVASKTEDKVILFDCKNFILDIWNKYLEPDQATWQATQNAMNAGTFPPNWQGGNASLKPTPIYSATVTKPTCLLASGGLTNSHFGDWSADFEKILIGTESGLVHVCSIAPFMDRYQFGGFFPTQPAQIYGSFQVGSVGCNITQMFWSRFDAYYGQVQAAGVMEPNGNPQPFGQSFFAVARADRAVYSYVTRFAGNLGVIGGMYRKITDKRIQDPVCACVATRNAALHIGDYSQNLVHGIQFGGVGRGAIYDSARGVTLYPGFYAPPDPTGQKGWSFTGSWRVGGAPFRLSLDNINAFIGLLSTAIATGLALFHAATSWLI